MTEQTAQNNLNGVIYEWEVMDRASHDRGWMWYLVSTTIGIALIMYAVFSRNFLFAILILLFSFIILLQGIIPAKKVRIRVTYTGLMVGNTFYPWRNFRSFFIIYEPPYVQRLYVERKDAQGHVAIELDLEKDPYELRDLMLKMLPENIEKDDEELMDTVRRIIKI